MNLYHLFNITEKLSKINLYLFTLTWLIAFLTWLPFLKVRLLFAPLKLETIPFCKWLVLHSEDILILFSFFLLLEAVIVILFYISFYVTGYYLYMLKRLHDLVTILSIYFMLFMQICKNLGITKYGILNLFYFFAENLSISTVLCFFTYLINLLYLIMLIIGYFYRH